MVKNSRNRKFVEIPHTADIQIIAFGETIEQLFSHAADGMYHVSGAQIERSLNEKREIDLEGPDQETLLVSFLEELIFLADQNLAVKDSRLNISLTQLSAKLPLYSLIQMTKEIKAVTFHEMNIKEKNGLFQTKIVFDV